MVDVDARLRRLTAWSTQEGWDRAKFPFGVYNNPSEMRADIREVLAALVARDAELAEARGIVEQLRRHGGDWIVEAAKRDREALEAEVTRLRAERDAAEREKSHQAAIVGDVREILRRWSQRGSGAEDALHAIAVGVGYYVAAGVVPPEQAPTEQT